MYQRNEATSVILPVHGGHFVPVLYYPIAGWLFQACIVFTRSRGVLPDRRVAIPSQYCITRSRGAASCQYCISRAPGGYSKPRLYYPFAGRLLQASIVSWIARWLFQASRVRVKMKVKADRSSRKITQCGLR